ncbi:MAG TPA: hypothetical protein VFI31_09450 [Pirellulales bacterium]|nr:hypothetical protein [Pirellulales bacterium]
MAKTKRKQASTTKMTAGKKHPHKKPAGAYDTSYCPQFFEYCMYDGTNYYYYYRCQICSDQTPPNCSPADVCVSNQIQNVNMTDICKSCGGTCNAFTGSRKDFAHHKFGANDVPLIDKITGPWTYVDNFYITPGPNVVDWNEYYLICQKNGLWLFRCVEIDLPVTSKPNLPSFTGVQVQSLPTSANLVYATYEGPESNDNKHHKIRMSDGGIDKHFHVVSIDPIS